MSLKESDCIFFLCSSVTKNERAITPSLYVPLCDTSLSYSITHTLTCLEKAMFENHRMGHCRLPIPISHSCRKMQRMMMTIHLLLASLSFLLFKEKIPCPRCDDDECWLFVRMDTGRNRLLLPIVPQSVDVSLVLTRVILVVLYHYRIAEMKKCHDRHNTHDVYVCCGGLFWHLDVPQWPLPLLLLPSLE